MLFNSYSFIFLFLPCFLAAWQLLGRFHAKPVQSLAILFLTASAVFYGLWGLPWLALLASMITINYFFALAISASAQNGVKSFISPKTLLIISICVNLAPLLWFKYSWFLIQNIALVLHADWLFTPPGLPLGISFYTFIQIAWLVGVYRGEVEPETLSRHALFSAAFPYIISGPIVRHSQLNWQFAELSSANAPNLAKGFTLFFIGLAKKTLLADKIGFYADAIFNAAEKNWPLTSLEAWLGSFCYSFQLYFDFSGYTDMALGLGLLIGLRLPENFNSPYKATGIIEFWRRWHITLSSWLRDFLYIPLGGNRKGKARQYLNLFLTMLLGGIWHGSGWTFMLWGAMHGFMLCINHLYRSTCKTSWLEQACLFAPVKIFSILLTFLCLNFCWVVFRALSLDAACRLYKAMLAGPLTMARPEAYSIWLPNNYFSSWQPMFLIALCGAICWFFPNSQQILSGKTRFIIWQPSRNWAIALALLAFASLFAISSQTSFLYFKF